MAKQKQQTKSAQEPNFIMVKSSWTVIKAWHILPFILTVIVSTIVLILFWNSIPSPFNLIPFGLIALSLIPVIIMIVKIINIKDDTISIYDNKVVQRSGIFSKYEHTNVLTPVLSVTVTQTFWGRICNYGDIKIDVVGFWDIDMKGIKNPNQAKQYFEKFSVNGFGMQQFITN